MSYSVSITSTIFVAPSADPTPPPHLGRAYWSQCPPACRREPESRLRRVCPAAPVREPFPFAFSLPASCVRAWLDTIDHGTGIVLSGGKTYGVASNADLHMVKVANVKKGEETDKTKLKIQPFAI
ncbi:hypothetical protein NUU61_006139 [Penicillium alfredii]|uniref:Uncharacterized protein n=1 Tax=Penicillium alfredii TaxID=1506179 RepID=A0A9W9F0G2_9EURO|nr:uncharacterized protein NUU61_006139 [Penicillium alfredii]KAJ5091269.1 hypothetical protein NUU61_006139 [Penicillium alfredii]